MLSWFLLLLLRKSSCGDSLRLAVPKLATDPADDDEAAVDKKEDDDDDKCGGGGGKGSGLA